MENSSVGVQVALRCRPMNKRELDLQCGTTVEVIGPTVRLSNPVASEEQPLIYTFDHAYFMESKSEDVYNDVGRPLVHRSLDGYNCTIFAYGQTGSGKTYTMMGDQTNPGIIPRLNMEVFQSIAKITAEDPKKQFLVMVSYLEIYNEELADLLNPGGKKLDIREHPTLGIYVQGLCEMIVKTDQDVLKLIEQGSAIRRVAKTNMNDTSSRSHSIFQLKIESKKIEVQGATTRDISVKAKINLVDLAGSERADKTGATGARLVEGAKINLSLMTLGQVIQALAESQTANGRRSLKENFIPYRSSKLTRLLQESLGGNSATLMIAAISPAADNYDETKNTLRYASQAKNIQNKVTKNEDVNEMMIRKLKEEIDRLKSELEGPDGGPKTVIPNPEMEQRLKDLEAAHGQTWEARLEIQAAIEAERQQNVENTIARNMEDMRRAKVDLMRDLTRLQQKKEEIDSLRKNKKEKLKEQKDSFNRRQERYEKLNTSYEAAEDSEKEKIQSDMQKLLDAMNKQSEKIRKDNKEIQDMKSETEKLKALIEEKKRELMTNNIDLEQNEKVKDFILKDEEKKFEEKKGAYLSKVLEKTRDEINKRRDEMKLRFVSRYDQEKSRIQAKITIKMETLTSEIDSLEEVERYLQEELKDLKEEEENHEKDFVDVDVRKEQLEDQLEELQSTLEDMNVEHKAAKKKYAENIKKLKEQLSIKTESSEQLKRELSILLDDFDFAKKPASPGPNGERRLSSPQQEPHLNGKRKGSNGKTNAESENKEISHITDGNGKNGFSSDEDYEMVKLMLQAFEKDQESIKKRYQSLQQELTKNLELLFRLQQDHESLKKELMDIVLWEPPIT